MISEVRSMNEVAFPRIAWATSGWSAIKQEKAVHAHQFAGRFKEPRPCAAEHSVLFEALAVLRIAVVVPHVGGGPIGVFLHVCDGLDVRQGMHDGVTEVADARRAGFRNSRSGGPPCPRAGSRSSTVWGSGNQRGVVPSASGRRPRRSAPLASRRHQTRRRSRW